MNKKLLLGLLLVVLLGGVFFAFNRLKDEPVDEVENSGQSQQGESAADTEAAFRESQDGQANEATGSQSDSSKQTVSVSISRLETTDTLVKVRAFADTLEEGICTLTFTRSGQTTLIYKEETQLEPSYVSCNAFDIPRSDFPSKGTWNAKVVFESSTYRGEASGDITL